MDAHEALHSRRTAHAYTTKAVPDEVVERALAAAHMAPCHKHTWPWRFTILGTEARAAMIGIATELKDAAAIRKTGAGLQPHQREAIRAKLGNPGAMIFVSQVRSDDPFRSKEDYAAVSCAVQNLCVSAWADGFASKWSTGGFTRDARAYGVLGIDAEVEEIVGCVFLGEAARLPEVSRPDVASVVRRTA